MKTISAFITRTAFALVVFLALIFITKPIFSQDSIKNPHQKKQVKVIVMKDKDGKSTVLDTTICLKSKADEAELKKLMKTYSISLEGLSDDLDNLSVQLDELDLTDSTKTDSLCKVVKKIRIISDNGKRPGKGHTFSYNYDFNDMGIPEPPPPPPPPSEGDFDLFGNYFDGDPMLRQFGDKGSTLSDVIGDIPMDRVKSYSIKETKHGKRIVIELNNGPMIDRRDNVIIIREPRNHRYFGRNGYPPRYKKIIVSPDDESPKVEKQ